MSALKEKKLCWEEIDAIHGPCLKFAKPELTEAMQKRVQAALAFKPLVGEEFEKLLSKTGDKAEQRGMVTGKITCKLPPDHLTKKAFIDPTPREFAHVALRERDGHFSLVIIGSNFDFLPGHLKAIGLPEDFKTKNLSLAEATSQGKRIESAYKAKKL